MSVKAEEIALILNDIRSAQNVGAIFRTADAIGVNKIFLCGITPSPLDRFQRERKDIAKSALGAEKTIAWESVSDCAKKIGELKKNGYFVVALEQSNSSVDYKKIKFKSIKVAVIIGNEVDGIPKKLLDVCDVITEIPMRGKKESLNVSVSTGIALYRFFDTD